MLTQKLERMGESNNIMQLSGQRQLGGVSFAALTVVT